MSLVSAHLKKKKRLNAQGAFISSHSPAGNLTVWGPFQSFLKCSVLEPKPFAERRLEFKQVHRTRDQKPKQKDFPPVEGHYYIFSLKKREKVK